MDTFYNFNEYNIVEDKEGRYGGTCLKYILEDSENVWMIKLPAKSREDRYLISYRNSSESEYIGCKIFKSVMINAQDVCLGLINHQGKEKVAVGCLDFCRSFGMQLVKLSDLFKYPNKWRGKYYEDSFEAVLDIIDTQYYVNKEELCKHYWSVFIVDALIGNYDRHLENIGILVDSKNILNSRIAPVYDCGSALVPSLTDEELVELLNDELLMNDRVFRIPLAAQRVEASCGVYRKVNYYYFFNSNNLNEDCKNALMSVVPNIDLLKINDIIDNTPNISKVRREFYKEYLRLRKTKILDRAYKKTIVNRNK